MYRYTHKKKALSQAKTSIFLIPDKAVVKNIESYLCGLTHSQFELLKYFLWMDLRMDKIYSSQAHIATHLGVGRQYVNKMIKKLCQDGVIGKQYRHLRTCVYKVSPFFRSRSTRDKISSFFTFFKKANLWALSQKATQVLNILNRSLKKDSNYMTTESERFQKKMDHCEKLEIYKKRMEEQKKNQSSYSKQPRNKYKPTDKYPKKEDSHSPEPPISSYQLMLQQESKAQVPINKRKLTDKEAIKNLYKIQSASAKATGFAKMLMDKFMPDFLVKP